MNRKHLYITLTAITIFAIAMVFPGCKKTLIENQQLQQTTSTMLHFNSEEEFFETSKTVMNMNEAERLTWEQQQDFKSYATRCYEICDELNSKDFKSEKEIFDFVDAHSNYMYVYTEKDEKAVRCYLETSSFKYLVNENQIVRIGDNAIKSFDEGIVIANAEKIDELLALKDFESSKNISDLTVIPSSLKIISETVEYPNTKDDPVVMLCNTPYEKSMRATDGRDRNTIQLICQRKTLWNGYSNEVFVYDMPEHRTLGIWFPARRTIFFNTNWEYRFRNQNYTGSSYVNEVLAYSIRRNILDITTPYILYLSLLRFSGWAYTYDTPTMYFDLR